MNDDRNNTEKRSYGLHNTFFSMVSKLSYNNRTKIITIAVLIPLIMIVCTLLYSYSNLLIESHHNQAVLETIRNNKTTLLSYAILENSNKAQLQANAVKESVVEDLMKEYNGNLEEMKKDFDNRQTNRFYKVLSDNIHDKFINKKNDNNRMYVATRDGVLIDDSINYSSNSFKSWDQIIEDTPNKILASDAIDIIQKKKNATVILWMDNTGTVLNRIQYEGSSYRTEMSFYSFVEKLVNEDKTDELLQYNIIVVSYIFDTEDIFGVPNIEAGRPNDNDVIYIVQTFNIKDMIESNTYLKNSLLNYDNQIDKFYTLFSNSRDLRVTMSILFVILEAIGFFCVWYLAEFFVYFHNPRIENKDSNMMKKV